MLYVLVNIKSILSNLCVKIYNIMYTFGYGKKGNIKHITNLKLKIWSYSYNTDNATNLFLMYFRPLNSKILIERLLSTIHCSVLKIKSIFLHGQREKLYILMQA